MRVFITGAGQGIGAAVATELARRGWSVGLADLDGAAAERVAAQCGEQAVGFGADVTDQAAVDAAVATTVERFGGLDVCFTNAGIAVPRALRHSDADLLARHLDVNVTGTWRTVRACLPHLIESRGYAALNASVSALVAPPSLGLYGASKAAVESLGDSLRREVRHHGVDVGVVYLLWVRTALVENADAGSAAFRAMRAAMPGPLGKTMPVEQAAAAVVAGIERRRRRIAAPRFVGALYRLRGFPGLSERAMVEVAPAVEEASATE